MVAQFRDTESNTEHSPAVRGNSAVGSQDFGQAVAKMAAACLQIFEEIGLGIFPIFV